MPMQVRRSERAGEKVKCHQCGTEMTLGGGGIYIVLSPHGKRRHRWCRECYSREAVTCSVCGDRYHNDSPVLTHLIARDGQMYHVCGKPTCRERIASCPTCGANALSDRIFRCHRCNERLCDRCYHDHMDAHYSDDGDDYDDSEDRTYCPCCDRTTFISHNWPNTKHVTRFLTEDGVKNSRDTSIAGMFFAGIELETEGTEDGGCMYRASRDVKKILESHPDAPVMYMKTDASLLNDGCELVTLPATLKYHQDTMPWEDVLNAMRRHDCQSHRGGHCGYHIHINKTYFGSGGEQTWNMIKLVALFAKFDNELWLLSRRIDDGFCRRPPRDFITHVDRIKDITTQQFDTRRGVSSSTESVVWRSTVGNGKYSAVNVSGERTVEIRLWRGTLNIETLLGTLELTKILIDMAKQYTMAQILGFSWDFVVDKARSENGNAIKYMERRGVTGNVSDYSEAQEG